MEKRKSIVLILTAILLMAIMAGIWLLLFPSRPARADSEETKQAVEMELEEKDEETGKYVPNPDSEIKSGASLEEKVLTEKEKPAKVIDEKEWTIDGEPIYNRPDMFVSKTKAYPSNYHTIGIYEGYVIELCSYSYSGGEHYEYCDVFDYFINNGVLRWNGYNGPSSASDCIPSNCFDYNIAHFDCTDCSAVPTVPLSGSHNFANDIYNVSGFTVEYCLDCHKYICTDFYKSQNPVGNWASAFPLLADIKKVECDFSFTSAYSQVSLGNISGFGAIDWGDGYISTSLLHQYSSSSGSAVVCSIYGLSVIPDEMLADNVYLTSITVPDIVTSIGRNVFDGCENLEQIVFDSATPCKIESDTFDGCDAPIYVPDASVATYKAEWSSYADRIVPKSTLNSSGNGSSGNSNSGSSGTGAGGGSSESFLSRVGLDGFSLDGLTDDTDVLGKIIAGVMLFGLVGVFFMIPSFKSKKRK